MNEPISRSTEAHGVREAPSHLATRHNRRNENKHKRMTTQQPARRTTAGQGHRATLGQGGIHHTRFQQIRKTNTALTSPRATRHRVGRFVGPFSERPTLQRNQQTKTKRNGTKRRASGRKTGRGVTLPLREQDWSIEKSEKGVDPAQRGKRKKSNTQTTSQQANETRRGERDRERTKATAERIEQRQSED